MLKRLDKSQPLIRLVARLSALLSKKRGLPVVIGVMLIIVGFVLQLINVSVASTELEILQIVVHNAGILIALIGFLLAEPLGD